VVTDFDGVEAPPIAAEPALLLPAKQAAHLCGVSTATWHRMIAAGRVPAPLKLSPGCVRWSRETLLEWIRSGCKPRKEFESLQNVNGRR
jgi:predicted DNA-binding transcriptional regulator AlpA